MGDKVVYLNRTVTKQTCWHWAAENKYEEPLRSPEITVGCASGKFELISPLYFEENGISVTVNSSRYIEMVNNFCKKRHKSSTSVVLASCWWGHDRASMAVMCYGPHNLLICQQMIFLFGGSKEDVCYQDESPYIG